MRSAEAVLTIIRDRGRRRVPLERVHNLLYNPDLYLRAYARLYPNKAAMTRGSTQETVEGMSMVKIERVITSLRERTFRWTPVRRVYIEKKNSTKKRPLGIPTWTDKLVQEVMRSILEAYYEPQFSDQSHGFRPEHGCHTALQEIQAAWKGTKWFIEGDIKQYFDTINHDTLIEILHEDIHDERFIQLIRELLKAGYLEEWTFNRTMSGTPQGGVISPMLSNIYLNRFDQWVENVLIPAHTRGERRKGNTAYYRINSRIAKLRKRGKAEDKELVKQRRKLSSSDPNDPDFRRLRYVSYADDFLLGYTGTKEEAEEIKRAIKERLRDNLKLDLSDEKTLITHARTEAARFLGYDIISQQEDSHLTAGRRSINTAIGLRVPEDVLRKKCAQYTRNGEAIHRPERLDDSDYSTTARYQQEYRGFVQYYLLAYNVCELSRLHYVMEGSLLKTLAAKHRQSLSAIKRKYGTTTTTADGKELRCQEVRVTREGKSDLVARFGGISLTRQPLATLDDQPQVIFNRRTELEKRLLAEDCELCGSREHIEVHHIRKLADLHKRGRTEKPRWVQEMAARRRKTLVVCRDCHAAIHAGRPPRQRKSE